MYLEHFGLQKNPFSPTPDPRFLFMTAKHREALAGLVFAVTERKGFMVLTGEVGTGKTTLVRKMLSCTPATCAQFSVIVNPALTRSELLETVLMDFGESDIPSSKSLRLSAFEKLLFRAQREGKTSVLVIDEAHLLAGELIEEVRLLSNLETSEQKLLQIILVGQNELNRVLDSESLRQVRQRVAIRMHLESLSEREVKRYIQTRWNRACSTDPLPFTDEALERIARSSGGIPRVINIVCDAALVDAYGAGTKLIGAAQIHAVLQDLHIDSATDATATSFLGVRRFSSSEARAVDRIAEPPAAGLRSLERYVPSKPKLPKIWKITNWFGTADGHVK